MPTKSLPSGGMSYVALVDPNAPTETELRAIDAQLVAMWLHGKSQHTQRAYRRDVELFNAFTGNRPLRTITLADFQAFSDSLTGAASSRGRTLAGIKSLLTFAAKIGVVPFNVGAALHKPPAPDTLAKRILTEADTARMLALTTGRDHALIRLLYASGIRVSELCGLRWADCADDNKDASMFVTVFGKGGKTRTVRISPATAQILRDLRADAPDTAFVFPGRKGASLNVSQARRIVYKAAKRAGLDAKHVSPHFLRHSHASHAIERGAKVTTVRDTLGHSSIAVTDRYAHARPGESSGNFLPV